MAMCPVGISMCTRGIACERSAGPPVRRVRGVTTRALRSDTRTWTPLRMMVACGVPVSTLSTIWPYGANESSRRYGVRASVTAIVPVFNGGELLGDAIRSIRAQTRAVDELLVVDDGSTDGSAGVAEELGARVIRLPENRGPSAARNEALRSAQGDIVAFLDCDDTWLPGHCALLVDALERFPECSVASAQTALSRELADLPDRPPYGAPFDALALLVRANFVPQAGAVARRETLLAVGGYDERRRLSEDYGLWLQVALHASFVTFSDITVHRRVHPGQATWGRQAELYRASWELRLALLVEEQVASIPERRSEIIRAMHLALWDEFRSTWYAGDLSAFMEIEAAAVRVPNAGGILSRWRIRRRAGWRAWSAVVAVREAMRHRRSAS